VNREDTICGENNISSKCINAGLEQLEVSVVIEIDEFREF